MKGQEREILLDQLDRESRKQSVNRPRRPPGNYVGTAIADDEIEAAVTKASDAFRAVLEKHTN